MSDCYIFGNGNKCSLQLSYSFINFIYYIYFMSFKFHTMHDAVDNILHCKSAL